MGFAEDPVHGQCARDVCRVQAVELDSRIHQDQVARYHCTVIAGPVQDAGVRPRCSNGVVADRIALGSGTAVEGALHQPLAPLMGDDRVAVGDHVVEPLLRGGDRLSHLHDLPRILHQPELGEVAGEGLVSGYERVAIGNERKISVVVDVLSDDPPPIDLLRQITIDVAEDDRADVDRVKHVLEFRQIGGE